MEIFQRPMNVDYVSKAINNILCDEKCHDLHGGNCDIKALSQFVMGCKSVFKMYLLVHLIPFLLFKRKKVVEQPAKEIKTLIINFLKSLLFAGGSLFLIRRVVCLFTRFHGFVNYSTIFAGFVAGLALLFESPGRQAQITLFCVNKSLDMLYNIAKRRNYPVQIPFGQIWLNAISLSILTYVYVNNPESFRSNYRKIIDWFLKDI